MINIWSGLTTEGLRNVLSLELKGKTHLTVEEALDVCVKLITANNEAATGLVAQYLNIQMSAHNEINQRLNNIESKLKDR